MKDFSTPKTIICSAGKGVLPTEECFDCALRGENACGYDYGLLKSLLNDSKRPDIHVTDLTGCLLKAYWSKVDPAPEYVHERLTRVLGTAVHSYLEGSDDFMSCEMPLEAYGVVGTCDLYYWSGRVVEYKSTRWMMPDKLPYSSHELQANIYAHLLRAMGYAVSSIAIQYIDMSGPTKCRLCKRPVRPNGDGELMCPLHQTYIKNAHLGAMLVEIPVWDEEEVDTFIQSRVSQLQMSIEAGIIPDAEPSFLCSYCAFVDHCPEGTKQTAG
jgi:CRISPR/Cas system-associated exonuclease Cas4 (RecB family)